MLSLMHEAMIEMVRKRPAVIAEWLAGPLKVNVPTFQSARLLSGDSTAVTPSEFRADAVIAFDGAEAADKPVLAVVFEAQRRPEKKKRLSWPVYVATTHARHDCPTALFVWCESRAVARWAAEPISTGDPGLLLTPVALGPDQIPIFTSVEEARRTPELAVMSILTHGPGRDPEQTVETLVGVLDRFDREHANLYAHLVATALPAVAKKLLEKRMKSSLKISNDEWVRTVLPETYAELEAKGMAEGKAKGMAEGKAEGKAEGMAKGRADALLTVLGARHIPVPDDARERITTCTDIEQLDLWVVRSLTVQTVEELFA